MRCSYCGYWGLSKEFEWDTFAFTSPSGQYPRICPQCKQRNLISKDLERMMMDEEAEVLLERMRQSLESAGLDIPKLKEDIEELLYYKGKSFRYNSDIIKLVEYANKKIAEAGG